MDEAVHDVIGADPPERRTGFRLLAAASGCSLLIGFGLGTLTSERASRVRDDEPEQPRAADPLKQADGGLVYVCDGLARAFVFADDLPPARTEVHLPLRGDDVLLPVLTDGAEVLTGSSDGHQYFVPQDGYLAMVQRMGVPQGPVVSAQVGDQRLTLAVRACGDGPR